MSEQNQIYTSSNSMSSTSSPPLPPPPPPIIRREDVINHPLQISSQSLPPPPLPPQNEIKPLKPVSQSEESAEMMMHTFIVKCRLVANEFLFIMHYYHEQMK